ncbi:hypothetical protein [Sulfurimonas marina]|uniref:Uncharacterized protein n=1 Tax=Sulfurimonas marina TaxID=2590551 RepID=A0A7M1ATE7_9BACT|nr:hypothetical protein [Sulfurimonas marina]QOP40670.1 hypothetical protein FJR03_02490 [Sulfurimonas marina]
MTIDWDAYKDHKQYSVRDDNFEITLEFLKSYYNMTNPYDIYDALKEDDIGQMMLKKRNITDAATLEKILYTI